MTIYLKIMILYSGKILCVMSYLFPDNVVLLSLFKQLSDGIFRLCYFNRFLIAVEFISCFVAKTCSDVNGLVELFSRNRNDFVIFEAWSLCNLKHRRTCLRRFREF